MTLNEFKDLLEEYSTNNIKALMGKMPLTTNERDDLRAAYQKLPPTDQAAAAGLLKAKGVDVV